MEPAKRLPAACRRWWFGALLALGGLLTPAAAEAQSSSPYSLPRPPSRSGGSDDPTLIPVSLQPPMQQNPRYELSEREQLGILLELEPPGPDRVFRTESEAALYERIRQRYRQANLRAEFPKDPVLGDGREYAGRMWAMQLTQRMPNWVRYEPLYFEEKNAERYGWDAGIYQPFLSAGKFYLDLVMLPYNFGVRPVWHREYNTGYMLPGDPVPYLIYIPDFSWTGLTLEAAAVVGYFCLFG